ncbi:hypothetical protein Tco_1027278 [Tanacetum coccineum]
MSHPSQAQGAAPLLEDLPPITPYGGYASQAPAGSSIPVSHGLIHPSGVFLDIYPFNAQPMYPSSNVPIYPNQDPSGLFADYIGCVTPFVHWIEDYPVPDRLKMASHVGSYDRKGDPDNFLYLFEGAICMQKWAMPVAYHMFTYTLKDSARIWWNGQKTGSILNYEDLKAKFRSYFSQQKKFTKTHLVDTLQILGLHEEQRISGFVHGLRTRSLMEFLSTYLPTTHKGLMEKTYTWIEAKEVVTNKTLNDHQERSSKFKRNFSWDNNKGRKNIDRFFPYQGPNHRLLSNFSKSPREILATKKVARTFEQPPRLPGSKRPRDPDTKKQYPKEEVNRRVYSRNGKDHVPPVSRNGNSSDPVIIKAKDLRKTSKPSIHRAIKFHTPKRVDHGHDTNQCRELKHQIEEAVKSGRLPHLVKEVRKGKAKVSNTQLGEWKKGDRGTTPTKALVIMISRRNSTPKRKSIEESTRGMGKITFPLFQETKTPLIQSLRVDSKVPLIGFSGEHSWPLEEVPLEIMIGEGPLNVPWSSRLIRYAKSIPNGKLIYNSIMNGPYVGLMIPEPGDPDREVPVNETFYEQTDEELTEKELK